MYISRLNSLACLFNNSAGLHKHVRPGGLADLTTSRKVKTNEIFSILSLASTSSLSLRYVTDIKTPKIEQKSTENQLKIDQKSAKKLAGTVENRFPPIFVRPLARPHVSW
jgi:hypothetical protein